MRNSGGRTFDVQLHLRSVSGEREGENKDPDVILAELRNAVYGARVFVENPDEVYYYFLQCFSGFEAYIIALAAAF